MFLTSTEHTEKFQCKPIETVYMSVGSNIVVRLLLNITLWYYRYAEKFFGDFFAKQFGSFL